MALPLLPGNSFNLKIGNEDFHKTHYFDFRNAVPTLLDNETRFFHPYSIATAISGKEPLKPSWITFDKYVLCFDAYFQEAVSVSQFETYRIRKCKVVYHLEDDTMQINEQPTKNSGMDQGTIISRHKFPKPPSSLENNEPKFYTMDDLTVGKTLDIYGRSITLINCDLYTRTFLTKMGYRVGDPIPEPKDPYTEQRKKVDDKGEPKRAFEKIDTLGQFLQYSRKVLHFDAIWDDRAAMFGDLRQMRVNYYLEDDTIEILETVPPNSGRDGTSTFLSRSKLPKELETLPHPGEMAPRTLLNISAKKEREQRYTLDNNPLKARKIIYYNDSDLFLGGVLHVWNRKLLLYDCDEFTKKFYQSKYGLEMKPIKLPEEPLVEIPKIIPPHNVFGSEEDSLQNCFALMPKPPKKDLLKFYQNEPMGFTGNKLRFGSHVITDDDIMAGRFFIVTYFLSDNTIRVYEPFTQNSGIVEGKHMYRVPTKSPDSPKLGEGGLPVYYKPHELYLGKVLHMRGNKYLLLSADAYTLHYMETHCSQYPMADIKMIMAKLRGWLLDKVGELRAKLESMDDHHKNLITYEQLREVVFNSIPEKITEHEMITVGRYYAAEDDSTLTLEFLTSLVQTDLRKKGFSQFEKFLLTFKHYDPEKNGYMTPHELYKVTRAYPLPVHPDILKRLIGKLPTNSEKKIDYCSFVRRLDWLDNPTVICPPTRISLDIYWTEVKFPKILNKITYRSFIEDITYGLRPHIHEH